MEGCHSLQVLIYFDMVCVAGTGIPKGREGIEVGDNGATVAGNQSGA